MSRRADYGTVLLTQMARESRRVISAAELAAETRLAVPTVSKVLKRLARNELVVAHRGEHGGYLLSRRPVEISMADIIDAVDGGLTECANHPGNCSRERICEIREHWRRVDRAVRKTLQALTLAEMTQPVPPSTAKILVRARNALS
ncbi:MAG: SUF system Fe-S cluster assembly regulator [Gammaproteobacteria bacterium]